MAAHWQHTSSILASHWQHNSHLPAPVREYLPVVLGSVASASLATPVTTYDPSVDPSILNEFATVAYR